MPLENGVLYIIYRIKKINYSFTLQPSARKLDSKSRFSRAAPTCSAEI